MNLEFAVTLEFVLIVLLALVIDGQRRAIAKHQKALKWFAQHVRIDPKSTSDPIPEDLLPLMEEIDREE